MAAAIIITAVIIIAVIITVEAVIAKLCLKA